MKPKMDLTKRLATGGPKAGRMVAAGREPFDHGRPTYTHVPDGGLMTRFSLCCGMLVALTTGGCYLMGGSHVSNIPGSSDSTPAVVKSAPPLKNPQAEEIAWEDTPKFLGNVVQVKPGEPAPTPLRAYIIGDNNDWVINRAPSGIIKDRTLQALVFYKGGASGKCREVVALLAQENLGGDNWGAPYLSSTGTIFAVTCASVEAQRPSPPPAS